ncbi:protein Flattop homolog [Lytechinus variegatus]|uniref:protein Flattop homolog n=1 Tax=Lytechinus variegatus TaxID=7654 RepID=UPI001BB28ED4|nr:protein Flattop homolog [Lytechinus variegatus]
MSSHFSANQYEQAFDSRRLQNFQIPKTYKERPSSYEGFTQIIATDRGHLKPGVPRSEDSPWGNFVGTWDMPKKIPGNVTTYMARGDPAVENIKKTRAEHNEYMRQAVSPDKTLSLEPKPQVTKAAEDGRPCNPSPEALAS